MAHLEIFLENTLRSTEKKPKGTDREVKSMRGSGLRAGDADSQLLQNIAKNMFCLYVSREALTVT